MKSISINCPIPSCVKNNHTENRIKDSFFPYAEDKASEAECCSCHSLPVSLLEGPIKIEKNLELLFFGYQQLYIIHFDFSRYKDSWAYGKKEAKRPVTAICSDHKGSLSTECLIKPFLSRILISYKGCRPLNPVQSQRWNSFPPLPLHKYQCHSFQCYSKDTKNLLLKAKNSSKQLETLKCLSTE